MMRISICVLVLCCSCTEQGKELTRKEFNFIILVGDAKKVWYSNVHNKVFVALRDEAAQNKRYRDDLPGDDLYDEPQYYFRLDSEEEYEAMMDSLASKLPDGYLTKKDSEYKLNAR